MSGTGVISNVPEIEWHHSNSPKDKEFSEIQVQQGEAVCGLCMKKCSRGIPVGLNSFTVIIFSSSQDGSCLLWVMSTETSVDIAADIAVDIAVDSRSIVGRQSVDSRSTVGRYSVDSRST